MTRGDGEDGRPDWDVAVIGAGPAGLSAGYAAARAGARTLVLEKAEHPRYKTCGGGLIGTSLAALAGRIEVPADDRVHRVTFTHHGRRTFSRTAGREPLLTMVRREVFDDRLRQAAVTAGAQVRQRVAVRGLEQEPDRVRVRLADGSTVCARVVVGADGSSGVSARHVGVRYRQVDLGLEVEVPVPEPVGRRWTGRLLLDWGRIPGSYGWVFPKGDRLTVGVIATRGEGERTRAYLRQLIDQVGLSGLVPVHDSGHLTRCRTTDSPVRAGRVLVAGDAGGLLEPWTREGISFALRSGALAGAAAAAGDPAGYERQVQALLGPPMAAGERLFTAFRTHPGAFHAALATPPGWRIFARFCRGELTFDQILGHRGVRAALALIGDRSPGEQTETGR